MNIKSSGKPYRNILHLAWPIIISNLSVPLLGAVDTAVIGHLPNPAYLGAVAIGTMIFSFIYWSFGFLKMGTTGFAAHAAGAGNYGEVRSAVMRAVIVGFVGGLVLIALQHPIIWSSLYLVETSPAVENGASAYFQTRIWGAPAALINYCLLGAFIGLGNTKAALVTQVFMNATNIVLDLLFVVVLDMKVPGVALATVASEYMGILLGAVIMLRYLKPFDGYLNWSELFKWHALQRLVVVNRDIFIRSILLISAFAYFTTRAAKLGEETLAATAILMNFLHFMSFGLDGFAHAAESVVGRSVGAKKVKNLDDAVKASTVLAVVVSIGYMLVYGFFGKSIIDLLTSIEDVRLVAYEYLPWIIALPIFSVWSFQFDGIFIGAMRVREMRNGMIISFICYMISVQFFPIWFGTDGLWAALFVLMIARALTLYAQYGTVRASAKA
jgi:MATE family, multidrug efflux pump